MKKEIFITIVITILFLGLAIQPSIATPQLKKIDVKPDVEGLVAQLRVVIDEILQDYGHIPIVRSLANTILDSLGLIGTIIFCVILYMIYYPFLLLIIILVRISVLLGISLLGYWVIWGFLVAGLLDIYCPPANPIFSLSSLVKPISSLIETNDITNIVDECPCMQE